MLNIFALILIITSSAKLTHQESYSLLAQNVNNLPTSGSSSSSRNRASNCLKGDCYPETGDLLIGRTKFLHASSTCGLLEPERYCVLGTTRDATKCFVCDSSEPYDQLRNTNSHTIENIVSRKQGDRFNRWWQSENGKQNVYIQFDLEAEFAFTHIIMTFKTFRPAAMIIEKSSDFGRSWKTHGYFASNCAESFPNIPVDIPKNLGDLYCESKYSSETPSTKGEVVFRILPPTLIQSKDPYSQEIQNLLKITNLRINFTKLHTFGDNLLDSREELKEKYYYSMYEMVVRGSCFCYGHASRCTPVEGVQYDLDKNGMVDGQCQCQHNTMGTNCEKCMDLFNDRPWQPARSGQTNECKKCTCYNHATSCRFNDKRYKETNYVTGGICDDCQHNTIGLNCEKCKENYWRDPERSIEDPNTCRPCLCDLNGSIKEGKCDPFTNETLGLIAGRCHCKPLVEGARCEKCKNGYFNLTKENSEGCEPCSCNLIGTSGNLGCDKVTGLCSCKAYVTGRACDQCLPGYFGLTMDDPNGCKPCDCSPGGSYDSSCDVISGQCNCKPNMYGRTCEKPDNGFYCPTLDHYMYEAESAEKLDDKSFDYVKQAYPDRKKTWTGQGFVRVFPGSYLLFTIDNIFKSGNYEIVIRYELPNPSLGWNDVRAYLVRHDTPDPFGVCSTSSIEDDKSQSIEPNTNYIVYNEPSCLEANKKINITLLFVSDSNDPQSQERSILVDSILLIPVAKELPALQGPDSSQLIEEFNHYKCKEAQLKIDKESISDECAKFICNIGVHNAYAFSCDCNPTGSLSLICDWKGGNCQCKPNVVGRKCDECSPSTYGFGSNGCSPCNCNSDGAKNNFCNRTTGQCDCYERITGKHCDECEKNFWNFPNCEPCKCNNMADMCNQTTGVCINCRDYTAGPDCGRCKDGYYGNPPTGESCKECQCPGLPSNNQFASTCQLDNSGYNVICNCKEGHIGDRCERCAINYYGKPLERGGSCNMCQCNGNVDVSLRSSCDESTGICQNCLYNTAGDHCESCKNGYYGNASNHDCKPCNCDPHGTEDNSALNCDQETGQCACLPNVIGTHCDMCKVDYYNLKSGEGCSYCNCDTDGTIDNSTDCNLSTGQCRCLDSRGGRTCNECKDGYWGDPKSECKKCECSYEGSISLICDKQNGSCSCRKGITGYSCSRCDRGTTGNIPYCTPCGECYDDWAEILNEVKVKLDSLEEKASNLVIASGSTLKDFTNEYNILHEKIHDIKKILSVNQTDRQLKTLQDNLANMEKQIQNKKDSLQNFLYIQNWNSEEEKSKLDKYRNNYNQHKNDMNDLNNKIMELKESNPDGAVDSITQSSQTSSEASRIIYSVASKVDQELKPLIDALKLRIDGSKENFENSDKQLKEYFEIIQSNLSNIESSIGKLNGAVCGDETSFDQKCSAKCGGAGCDYKCGTNSSTCSGLMDSFYNLLEIKKNFDASYNKQELQFKRILTQLKNSSNILNNSNKNVDNLLEYANKSMNSINSKKNNINELIAKIELYIQNNQEKPIKIDNNCGYVIDKKLEIQEIELESILNKISQLAAGISVSAKVDKEAENSQANSLDLIQNADRALLQASNLAIDLKNTDLIHADQNNKTNMLQNSLDEFQNKNNDIQAEVENSVINIANVSKSLDEVQNTIENLKNSIDLDSKDKSAKMNAKQESLKSKVKESGVTLERTKISLKSLKTKLDDLTSTFQALIKNKDSKNGADILESLINLQSKIIKQKNSIDQKSSKIENLLKVYDETKIRINELKDSLDGLRKKANSIKEDIQAKEKYFNSCS